MHCMKAEPNQHARGKATKTDKLSLTQKAFTFNRVITIEVSRFTSWPCDGQRWEEFLLSVYQPIFDMSMEIKM